MTDPIRTTNYEGDKLEYRWNFVTGMVEYRFTEPLAEGKPPLFGGAWLTGGIAATDPFTPDELEIVARLRRENETQ